MRETLTFFGQLAAKWRETGAIAPSGPQLARAMTRMVGPLEPGEVIIELGPGTGSLTKQLAKEYPDNPLIAVEFNPVFVKRLRHILPQITVIEGCASKIGSYLSALSVPNGRVGAVVSGLPLLVMPKELTRNIFSAIACVLPAGRPYVQFTYSERAWRQFDMLGFEMSKPHKVWLNLPPAVVLPFTRAG
jgi:phosphatidylethanolamine/phosphatidyl-N-methylethanolamine N-methyltransferase